MSNSSSLKGKKSGKTQIENKSIKMTYISVTLRNPLFLHYVFFQIFSMQIKLCKFLM